MATDSVPKVSIIIPCREIGPYALESISHCLKLDYPNYEVLLLPDSWDGGRSGLEGVDVVPTGPMGPPEKRDLAAQRATGEILAFIDDDAFPKPDWLTCALPNFKDPHVGAVGGPAVTPSSDTVLLQASGAVYQSLLGGGSYAFRYTPGRKRKVNDYPTCNLLVRKSTFLEAGGFDTSYWPGEDTKLCLAIIKRLGKSIVYEPSAIVYHHRRNLFNGHLKQVASYALHRGFFVKRFPETSRAPSYFLPSAWLLGLLAGLPMLFFPIFRELYVAGIGLYLLLVLLSSAQVAFPNILLTSLVTIGTVITHAVYGLWFIKGLTSKQLKR